MKTQILVFILIFISASLFAQVDTLAPVAAPNIEMNAEPYDTVHDESFDETPEEGEINETPEGVAGEYPEDMLNEPEKTDTVHIRVGNRAIEIITEDKKTHIDVDKLDDFESRWEDNRWKKDDDQIETVHHHHKNKFDGHWSGIDFGGNQLLNTSYPTSIYPEGTPAFITTAPEKSFEVNLNLLEYSFGFSSYFGIVTGLGLNFNDYKFKNRYTLVKDDTGVIQPASLPEGDFRLSKLSTTFITAPLLLEVQIPGQFDHKRIFIAAGVIGGVKIHEHIKTQIGEEKKRDNGDFNINPLRWGYTARIGFENMGIFATYYNTKLFKEGFGPDTTPATIGITFTF
jgi:hypothetical protein